MPFPFKPLNKNKTKKKQQNLKFQQFMKILPHFKKYTKKKENLSFFFRLIFFCGTTISSGHRCLEHATSVFKSSFCLSHSPFKLKKKTFFFVFLTPPPKGKSIFRIFSVFQCVKIFFLQFFSPSFV